MVVAELAVPAGKLAAQPEEHRLAAFELDMVVLPVVKADGFDRGKALERPGKTGRRILTAGKQYLRLFRDHVGRFERLLGHADEMGPRRPAINKPAPPAGRPLLYCAEPLPE